VWSRAAGRRKPEESVVVRAWLGVGRANVVLERASARLESPVMRWRDCMVPLSSARRIA